MFVVCRPCSGRTPERVRTVPAYRTVLFAFLLLAPQRLAAQVAEIQVYQGEIAAPGTFSATLHANYTPDGRKTAESSGVIVADGALTLGPEIAYGVTDWFEVGMLAPIVSSPKNGGWQVDGAEFRALFVAPHADSRAFFYGINLAFVVSEPEWNPHGYALELRPILGWHLGNIDLIFNPILESELDGFNRSRFTPATRLAYRASPQWAFALEHYADIGAIKHLSHGGENSEQVFAVADYYGETFSAEIGAGFGLSSGSDNLVVKLILSRQFE